MMPEELTDTAIDYMFAQGFEKLSAWETAFVESVNDQWIHTVSTWKHRGFQLRCRQRIFHSTLDANGGDSLSRMVEIIRSTNPRVVKQDVEAALLYWQTAAYNPFEGTANYGREYARRGNHLQSIDQDDQPDREESPDDGGND